MSIFANKKYFLIVFLGILSWLLGQPVFADVSQSGNYKIQSDSFNFGGGLTNNANFKSESTFGEAATGEGVSVNFKLKAGYQQMQEVYLSLSSSPDIALSPAIPGLTGGTATGLAQYTVITDNAAGYSLSIKSQNNPAMLCSAGCSVGIDNFANYSPAGANPDSVWSIANTTSAFGFSPSGDDLVAKYKNDGSACNAGSNTSGCWNGLSTTNEQIANTYSANHPDGALTTIEFRAQSGSDHLQPSGAYQATIVVTAIAN